MITSAKFKKAVVSAALLTTAVTPALAHVDAGVTSSFSAGFGHPFSGLDHMTVMIAVGLWAALKGGKAIWAWPVTFVAVMLAGAVLGMLHVPVPFVEPSILASVVALGLLVALAVDFPVSAGVAVIGLVALFHGYAHGAEVPESAAGLEYMGGFALATTILHGLGIIAGLGFGLKLRSMVRAAGAACVGIGASLAFGLI